MSGVARTPVVLQASRPGQDPFVRYELLAEIGSGGMASVQYGRLRAPHGFVRSVAIKRLHAQFAKDPEFVKMFIDEARLSARLTHANIVATLDVVDAPGELALVMDYVHGESLWDLLQLSKQFGQPVPVRVATALIASVLHGLQFAHEAKGDDGEPLQIVHRDVSPHNILVGGDGIPRLIDFGIAKAVGRLHATPSGEIKGKLIYMSPEQLSGGAVDPRADVYGAAAVLWEVLAGRPVFDGASESAIIHSVLLGQIDPIGQHRREVSRVLEGVVMRGLRREPAARFSSAREMALALEHEVGMASQSELADWLHALAGGRLAERSRLVTRLQDAEPAAASAPSGMVAPTHAAAFDGSGPRHRHDDAPPTRAWLRLGVAAFALFAVAITLWARSSPMPALQAGTHGPRPAPAYVMDDAPVTSTSAAEDPDLPRGKEPPPLTATAAPSADVQPETKARTGPKTARTRAAAAHAHAQAKDKTPKLSTGPACRPWYFMDEDGIRRPKPGCL